MHLFSEDINVGRWTGFLHTCQLIVKPDSNTFNIVFLLFKHYAREGSKVEIDCLKAVQFTQLFIFSFHIGEQPVSIKQNRLHQFLISDFASSPSESLSLAWRYNDCLYYKGRKEGKKRFKHCGSNSEIASGILMKSAGMTCQIFSVKLSAELSFKACVYQLYIILEK